MPGSATVEGGFHLPSAPSIPWQSYAKTKGKVKRMLCHCMICASLACEMRSLRHEFSLFIICVKLYEIYCFKKGMGARVCRDLILVGHEVCVPCDHIRYYGFTNFLLLYVL